jgi:cytochrome c553
MHIRPSAISTFLGITLMAYSGAARADGPTGEQIYRQRCASCHGASGEGTQDGYSRPLAGDKSAAQLARLIAKTMPKDADEKCSADEAARVAAYIFEAFYSPAAQARNHPPRVELSRLTVNQYRNAVADLVGTFRSPGRWDAQRGLRAVYFKSYGFRRNNQVFDRMDPEVHFDFGTASPDAVKIEPDRFSIRWEGSVLAPETGEYEFIVHTEHATRLWVNDRKRPLIDAFVKSGNDTEYRASIFLLGGRAYPLRLDFAKGKQGEPDGKKDKSKPPPVKASVALEWKLPQRTAEVIPSRNLSPNAFPETFVVTTAFPADDRSIGYERGTSVSKAWDQAATEAALETAGYVAGHLRDLAGLSASEGEQKLRDFCKRFAERAFRRPLTAEQQKFFVERLLAGPGDLEIKAKRFVLLVLKSPRFLYREVGGEGDPFDVAARMSFALWDSLPDQELWDAATKGRLATREQVTAQAERMLTDLRAHGKLRDFFFSWLKVNPPPDLSKDPKQFPGFDRAVASDLRTSLDLFLEDVAWGLAGDFRELFLTDSLYLNGRLARLYGADLPADAPFQKVPCKSGERAGVLSHPYLLATFAYTSSSSPIHRGVFLARNVLGQVLRPPPEAFTPLPASLHPELTTRERVTLQTRPQACQSCHGMINPLGFTLENFDALGRFRDQEKGRPIDATGTYETRAGKVVQFHGLRDLATFLAGSDEAQEAFVERLFHHLVKQPVRAYGPRKLVDLRRSFADNRYNIRKLMVDVVATSALGVAEDKRKAAAGRSSGAPN